MSGYGAITGKMLVGHPLIKKIDVIGGTSAGRATGAITGGNLAYYTTELVGKALLVVFGKANVNITVNGITFSSFIVSGQTCLAATRIII